MKTEASFGLAATGYRSAEIAFDSCNVSREILLLFVEKRLERAKVGDSLCYAVATHIAIETYPVEGRGHKTLDKTLTLGRATIGGQDLP